MAGNFNYQFINQFQPAAAAAAQAQAQAEAAARQQLMGGNKKSNATNAAAAAAAAAYLQVQQQQQPANDTTAYYNNPGNIFSQVQSIERVNWLLQSQGGGVAVATQQAHNQQQQQQQLQQQQHHLQQQQAAAAAAANQNQSALHQHHQDQQHIHQQHGGHQQQQQNQTQQPLQVPEKEKVLFRCPDCTKSFKHASGLFIHASQTHYANELQNAYWPEIELTNACPVCSKSIDKTKYLAHIGGKHKKIILFMTNEKREAYLNVEKQKFVIGRRKRKIAVDSKPGSTGPIEDKFRCPDCDKPFPYVAPLYIHAATTHYNEQIKAKYFPLYREHGKCHLCGHLVSQASLVSHFGGKHRRILTFMPEDKRQLYMSMKKRTWTNFRETGGLVCAYEGCVKTFKNLTMYKQHLANTHVRTELLNQTRANLKDGRCSFCGKVLTKPYSLLQHIGTCHNQIMNYVTPEVHRQLTQLGVKDED